MSRYDIVVESKVSRSVRARQLEGMFDVPPKDVQAIRWQPDLPIEANDWNVGLIVGPSGSGKSTIARHVFRDAVDTPLKWGAASVLDDFDDKLGIEEISKVCQAVGFNTIPAWLRPFSVLSNGERFRVEIARRLLEQPDPIVIDEFTSVVDRQVAKIGCHAVQKYVRRHKRRLVAVTCHYDVIDWLQPDWVYEPASDKFARRAVQRRPSLDVELRPVSYDWWSLFAPFHYLTAELNRAAKCYVLFVEGQPAAFCGVLAFPHRKQEARNIRRNSRTVVLPDYQGLGLAFVLMDTLGACHATLGYRFRCYPAHPPFIRSFRPEKWRLVKRPGQYSPRKGNTSTLAGTFGSRACAVFEYRGDPWPQRIEAMRLTGLAQARS